MNCKSCIQRRTDEWMQNENMLINSYSEMINELLVKLEKAEKRIIELTDFESMTEEVEV